MNIMKYSGRVLISKIDNTTGLAVGNESIQNNGTVSLWRLLCGLLETGDITDTAGIGIPAYIDMGYFYEDKSGRRTAKNIGSDDLEKPIPSESTKYQSIIGTLGSIILDKQILNESKQNPDGTTASTSNPVLNLTAYFSLNSFTYTDIKNTGLDDAKDAHIYITLKDTNTGTTPHILAIADTESHEYRIADNETHIIKWQLSFQNIKPTTVQGS